MNMTGSSVLTTMTIAVMKSNDSAARNGAPIAEDANAPAPMAAMQSQLNIALVRKVSKARSSLP
jgi:hypothetical protein